MWDIFISHASEDKESLVRGLAKQLREVYKVKVWYDEYSLEYGDSLIDSIENGLKNCNYGIVVLSKSFFEKAWPKHEYTGLKNKELILNKKVIIPIWYNITKNEVSKYSLTLSDKWGIYVNKEVDINDLAVKIIKIIRPDIYDNISRMFYLERNLKNCPQFLIDSNNIKKIPIPPIRHKSLDIQMTARLKLIYNTIKEVDERTYNEYEQDFRRSINIDREIIITELLTAAYIDCINTRNMSLREKREVYELILSLNEYNKSSTISNDESNKFMKILKKYIKDINAAPIAVMEYKFE